MWKVEHDPASKTLTIEWDQGSVTLQRLAYVVKIDVKPEDDYYEGHGEIDVNQFAEWLGD